MKIILTFHDLLKRFEKVEFLPLVLIRAYLFFVLWFAGVGKIDTFDKFSGYLGTLGVPLPDIFTWLVIVTEAGGGALILIGLFVRWACVPLLVVMFFAGYLVHYQNGWPHEANGIEFAAIYSLMLLTLLCFGGGKYLSLDYWVSRKN
tara:strand:+ start:145 stop:585 length:441 start_codon:yes stop_codon:yes gene_type:complete